MANDIELRRRAIADALRDIMAEPLPAYETAPSQDESAPPVALACANAFNDTEAESAARVAHDRQVTDEWDKAEFTELFSERADSTVPAVESVGAMSRTASLALFGHA